MAGQILNLTKNHTTYRNYKHEATIYFKMNEPHLLRMVQ